MPSKRPKGEWYDNLRVRPGDSESEMIYFEGIVDGQRRQFSCRTEDWDVAAAFRDLKVKKKKPGTGWTEVVAEEEPEKHLFRDVAVPALEWEEKRPNGLAPTSMRFLRNSLRKDGPILGGPHLKDVPVAELRRIHLRHWWRAEIEERKPPRSEKTGQNLLDVIQAVMEYARQEELCDDNHDPVKALRKTLKREAQTQEARAKHYAKQGVLTPAMVGSLVQAAEAEGPESLVSILLATECGLRRGEITALRWGSVHFGDGENDPSRAVLVKESLSSGYQLRPPKSGKNRRPHISRRLHRALKALQRKQFKPAPHLPVLFAEKADPSLDDDLLCLRRTYRVLKDVILRRCLEQAGLVDDRDFQNLRATASSLMKQWGVEEKYVQAIIGHDSAQVAAKHYDSLDFTIYRPPEPLAVERGEVPADLFERLCVPTVVPTVEEVDSPESAQPTPDIDETGNWEAPDTRVVLPKGRPR